MLSSFSFSQEVIALIYTTETIPTMPNITRFRTTWGIPPGDNFATWRQLFPELKAKGYSEQRLPVKKFGREAYSKCPIAGVEIDYRAVKTEDLPELRKLLDESGLQFIAQYVAYD